MRTNLQFINLIPSLFASIDNTVQVLYIVNLIFFNAFPRVDIKQNFDIIVFRQSVSLLSQDPKCTLTFALE